LLNRKFMMNSLEKVNLIKNDNSHCSSNSGGGENVDSFDAEAVANVSQEIIQNSETLSIEKITLRIDEHEKILKQREEEIISMEKEINYLNELTMKQANQIVELEKNIETISLMSSLSKDEGVKKQRVDVDNESIFKNYKCTAELEGHTDCVWDIATTIDGNFIVASGHDFSVRCWTYDGTKWANSYAFTDHTNFVKGVDCRVVNDRILVGSSSHDHTIKCRDGQTGVCLWTQNHTNSVLGITIGDILVASAGFYEKSFRISQLGDGTEVRTIANAYNHTAVYTKFRDPVNCQQIVTVGNEVANRGMMKLFDVETGSLVVSSRGEHEGWIWRVTVTDDGQFAITSSYIHKKIKVWDLDSGELVRQIDGHDGGVYQLATCRYEYLVSAGQDKNVNLWNWQTGRFIKSFRSKSSAFRGATCSPDGRWICGGGGDRNVLVWSL